MLYCDAATFCRRRNDAGVMTDETGRRCAQESIDIIIMKKNIIIYSLKNNFDYLLTNGITMEWDCNQLATAKVVFEIFR